MDLGSMLNPVQKQAVQITEGPLLILAGAGSGKTSVLTHRIAHLIERKIQPYNILAITFTNKAAREMRERVDNLVENGRDVLVCTFHSFCVRILRREISKLSFGNHFTIYDSDDSEKLIKRCIKEVGLNEKQYSPRSVMGAIGAYKDELISPKEATKEAEGDYRQSEICKVYTLYQKRLYESNAVDFDDIISKTVELFKVFPDVLEKYQERFQYIMVDEYQDTNTAQYMLIKMLSSKYKNLCVVGDDDQSIYGWRGANIYNILNFEKDNKGAKSVKLEQNYRSTQLILDAANAVIQNNQSRKQKRLWTNNSGGSPIYFFKATYDYEEAHFITEKITDYVNKGAKYADHAVLYRTNSQSRTIEEQLVSKGIPYRLFGGVRFYDRKEVKDVLAYLRVINNPRDDVSLMRIINVPRRGIGDTTTDKIQEYAVENDIPLFEVFKDLEQIPDFAQRAKKVFAFRDLINDFIEYAKNHSITEVINKVLEDTNYIGEYMVEGTDEAMGRIENVQELLSKASEYEDKAEDKSLTAFLEELSLVADIDNYTDGQDTVVLMTLHNAKGLEFPCVFITGFEEGIFPTYQSTVSPDRHAIEEERRLLYVGITRAKETLYITCANSRRQHGQIVSNNPSRFLKEIPEEYIEQAIMPISEKGEKRRTGISQFAEINKMKNAIDISFGGKNYSNTTKAAAPAESSLNYSVGDKVKQMKYGIGVVTDIRQTGPDYEVAVEFEGIGVKKFMAHLCKLKKVEG